MRFDRKIIKTWKRRVVNVVSIRSAMYENTNWYKNYVSYIEIAFIWPVHDDTTEMFQFQNIANMELKNRQRCIVLL